MLKDFHSWDSIDYVVSRRQPPRNFVPFLSIYSLSQVVTANTLFSCLERIFAFRTIFGFLALPPGAPILELPPGTNRRPRCHNCHGHFVMVMSLGELDGVQCSRCLNYLCWHCYNNHYNDCWGQSFYVSIGSPFLLLRTKPDGPDGPAP